MYINSEMIGQKIKHIRREQRMSQSALAQKLNKTLRTVQKYESGEIMPSLDMIDEIALALGVSPADIIGYRQSTIEINSVADVLTVLYQLDMKVGLRYEIDVNRTSGEEEWNCCIRFDARDAFGRYNADLCVLLEEFRQEREKYDRYIGSRKTLDAWWFQKKPQYEGKILVDKAERLLSDEELLHLREGLSERTEKQTRKKATPKKGDQD